MFQRTKCEITCVWIKRECIEFKVTINVVNEIHLPKVDKDFVKKLGLNQEDEESLKLEIKKKSSKNNFKIKIKEGCLSSNKSVNILKQEDKSYEIKILEKEKESEIISDIVLKNGIISYEKAVASIESIFIENVTNE